MTELSLVTTTTARASCSYVSIRHGGYEVGDGNEINGLTLGGVGTATLIDHVEVVSNQDDGIEFFGGTVGTSHMAMVFNQDDSYDIDEGHTGTHQFWFAVQNPNSADNGGEWDGVTGSSKGSTDASVTRSAPQIYNATFVGAGPTVTGSDKGNNAFLIDDYFAGRVYNSVFHDFGEGFVEVTSDGEGGLQAENSLIGAFGSFSGTNPSVLDAPAGFLVSNPFFNAVGTPQNGHSAADNAPEFSLYERDGSAFLVSLDPRPSAGSPLLPGNGATITAGAPVSADYQGAFGAGDLWLNGWTWFAEQGYTPDSMPSTDVDVIATQTVFDAFYGVPVLEEDTTWTKNNVYILTDRLYVKEGSTLTIEPGTKIYGSVDDNGTPGDFSDDRVGAVIVARGGELIANGTAEEPIVFDAVRTLEAQRGLDLPYDPDTEIGPAPTRETGGLWGGLILLGNAYIAFTDGAGVNVGNNIIEGFLPATAVDNDGDGRDDILEYGFDENFPRDDEDSSGIVRYVSIRHGGYEVGDGNEINGLTLGGVGSDTIIEYVEVVSNQDDGIEFFGGTVSTKNIALIFNQDDSFDIDEGHTGTHQFWFAIQNPNSADNGGEWDGVTGSSKSSTDASVTRSAPQIYNATFVGPGAGSGVTGSDKGNNAFLIDDYFAGRIYNSIFHDFAEGFVEVTSDGEGGLVAENNTIGDFGSYAATNLSVLDAPAGFLVSNPFFTAAGAPQNGHTDVGTSPGFTTYTRDGSNVLTSIDPRPSAGSSPRTDAVSDAPEPVDYRGAFGEQNWLLGWTWMDETGLVADSYTPAPGEDIDVIGTQTVANAFYGVSIMDGSRTWTKDNTYILTDRLYVGEGDVLRIEPGTRIYSTFDDNGTPGDFSDDKVGAIIVARGGKLIASGTAAEPIVFDAIQSLEAQRGVDSAYDPDLTAGPAPDETTAGLWGGLILLGNAYIAFTDGAGVNVGNNIIEGFLPATAVDNDGDGRDDVLEYGFDENFPRDDEDSSGIVRYVSIRHGGYEVGDGNEINGLTLGGVGSATQIDHVEVVSNQDDGIEFFGGTVGTSHMAMVFNQDDSYDIDEGHTGTHQFWFAVQNPNSADNGGEWDGVTGSSKSSTDASVTRSAPQIYNATFVGAGPTVTGSDKGNNAFLIDDYFAGRVYNSVFHDFGEGFVEVTSDGEGGLQAENSLIGAFGSFSGTNPSVLDAPAGFLVSNPFFNAVGTPQNGHSAADNAPEFSLYERDGSAFLVSLDPRPSAGSPLLPGNGATITAGAPVSADYQGAFGAGDLWLNGWTWFAEQGYTPDSMPSTDVDVIATQTVFDAFYGVPVLEEDTTWTKNNVYILTDRLYVKEGSTLTIEPGTKIYGSVDDNGTPGDFSDDRVGAVIVARGGELIANGTAEEPIVFDAVRTLEAQRGLDLPYDPDTEIGPAPTRETGGLWGGLILLGNAYIAFTDGAGVNVGNNIIEGFLPATAVDNDGDGRDDILEYGFDENFPRDDEDSSGIVRYVSIRHGGYEVGDGNEINGLTLGGVGSDTIIEYVEVVSNQDDGIEFFGGTVSTKNIALIFNQDDSFDIDEGHTGTHQFWFAIQNPNSADNGGEWDGVTGSSKSSTDASVTRSAPQIYNATFVGPGAGSGVTGSDKGNNAFLIDDYFAGRIYNSIFHDFAEGFVEVTSDGEGGLVAENNTIGDFGSYAATNLSVLDAPAGFLVSNPFFTAAGAPQNGHTDVGTSPGFTTYTRDGSNVLTSIDPRPSAGSSPRTDAVSDAPEPVDYRGAFGEQNWLLGWTWMDETGLVADSYTPAPGEDIDVIGTQTVANAFYGVSIMDGSRTWTKDNTYILTDRLYVGEGDVLRIEPGTRIYSTFDDNGTPGDFSDDKVGAIIVARGGKLIASGTAAEPIVFDAIQSLEAQRGVDSAYDPDLTAGPAPDETTAGLWGGLILLGNAYIAFTDGAGVNVGNNIIEGFLPATAVDNDGDGRDDVLEYGFDENFPRDDEDSSGIVRYVSIRHGGYEVGDGNEINGLTLGGVGSATQIDHVEVVSNQDDGIEFFGGTVGTSHMAMVFNQDDSYDIDEGHTGTHQFWFAVQNPNSADNGGEWDGVTGSSKSSTDASVTRSAPQIYNATFVGAGPTVTGSDKGNNAFLIDDYFAGRVYNSVFHDFGEGFVEVTSDGEGGLQAENSLIGAFGSFSGTNPSVLDAPAGFLVSNPFFNAVGTPQNGHSAADNAPEFSLYERDGSAFLVSLDPRPSAGSPLLPGNGATITAGAPVSADYQGAFGAGDLWLNGWTWFAEQGYTPDSMPSTDVDVIATQTVFDAFYGVPVLEEDTTWTKNNVYILTDRLYVKEGSTLTIEPGTKIYGSVDDNGTPGDFSDDRVGAVIVARGGELIANGTAEEPIVFDAVRTLEAQRGLDLPYDPDTEIGPAPTRETGGLWGGLILLGNAYIAFTDGAGVNVGNNIIEGFLPATAVDNDGDGRDDILEYGFDENFPRDDEDSSGIVRYVSIRHGGYEVGDGNEINGLTLGGVGSDTIIEYVEVVSNQDDGIEFFGGTVSTKNIALIFNQDDSFDIDEGHTGTHQFWFAIQNPNSADNGGEWDGVTGSSKSSTDASVTRSAPQIYNATFVGPGAGSGVTGSDKGNNAFLIDDYFAGRIYNSIFHDFAEGFVEVTSDGEGGLVAENNTIGDFGSYAATNLSVLDAPAGFLVSNPFFTAAGAPQNGHTDVGTSPGFTTYTRDGSNVLTSIDPRPSAGSSPRTDAVSDAPEPVDYRGAFGEQNWLLGWTWMDETGLVADSYTPAPGEDIDVIGTQTVANAFYGVSIMDGSRTWTKDNTYILTDRLYVGEGDVLRIEPGTRIYSTFDDNGTPGDFSDDKVGAIIVARGGKLIASGTAAEPIVFDAIQSLEAQRGVDSAYDPDLTAGPAPDETTAGLWGGLILLGNAYIAFTDGAGVNVGNNIIEGFLPATAVDNDGDGRDDVLEYGFDENFPRDDEDSSGIVRYVSIRHGGYEVGDGNEINGLTLGGVGSATHDRSRGSGEQPGRRDRVLRWHGRHQEHRYVLQPGRLVRRGRRSHRHAPVLVRGSGIRTARTTAVSGTA